MRGSAVERSPFQRRRRWVVLAALFCLVAVVAGLVGARFVESPAEQAARTAPPPLSLLSAPVRRAVLTATVTTRGTVVSGGSVESAPTSAVGASLVILTASKVRIGESVRPGMVVAEVSGRPVIALSGQLPAYRDLRIGSRGRDVTELQKALASLGISVGADPRSEFGHGTASALAQLYAARGYSAAGGASSAYLPMSEVLYVPSFPAFVSQVDSAVGEPLNVPAVTVSYGALRTTAQLDPTDSSVVKEGTPATLISEVLGKSVSARVVALGSVTQGTGGLGNYLPVILSTTKALPPSWLGEDVEVIITSARTSGPVLLVPLSAVSTSANGQTTVSILVSHNHTAVIPVTTGPSADGLVQVVGNDDHQALKPGEQVVVGRAASP